MGAGASASVAGAVGPASVRTLREGLKDLSATDRAKLAVALCGDANVFQDVVPQNGNRGIQMEWQEKEWMDIRSQEHHSRGGQPLMKVSTEQESAFGVYQQEKGHHTMTQSHHTMNQHSHTRGHEQPKQYKLRSIKESVQDVAPGPEEKGMAGTKASDFQQTVDHDESGISEVLAASIESLSSSMFNMPFSVSVALPGITDTPLIGISDGFCRLSGYSRDEIVGQNCRFLLKGVPQDQISKDTRQEARRYCRAALLNLTSIAHSLLLQRNARKNGELFWNLFMLTMVPGPGKMNFIVGLQLDLGRDLPGNEKASMMESRWFQDHRDNLLKVQRSMFANNPGNGMGPANGDDDKFTGLAEDIQAWLLHAEKKTNKFRQAGTAPWVAWPSSRRYAIMNGGVDLLRLEADRVCTGCIGMSIFPVTKKPGMQSFKIRIVDICTLWEPLLPSMGFTMMSPADIDRAGGLPKSVRDVPESVVLCGDGRAFCVVPDPKKPGQQKVQPCRNTASSKFEYAMKAQDVLECIWGTGFLKIEVNGRVLFHLEDSVIFAPSKQPAYAILDQCGPVCCSTLMDSE